MRKFLGSLAAGDTLHRFLSYKVGSVSHHSRPKELSCDLELPKSKASKGLQFYSHFVVELD